MPFCKNSPKNKYVHFLLSARVCFQSPGPGETLFVASKERKIQLVEVHTWVNKPYDINQLGCTHLLSYFW